MSLGTSKPSSLRVWAFAAIGLVLGIVAVMVVQRAGSWLGKLVDVLPQAPRTDFSVMNPVQGAWACVQTFLAGAAYAGIITVAARVRPGLHVVICGILLVALQVAIFVMKPAMLDSPTWFLAIFTILIPVQLYVGYRVGLLFRGSSE